MGRRSKRVHTAYHRRGDCDGKQRFISLDLAFRASKRKRGRIVYKCAECRCWHVGTLFFRE